MKQPIEKQIAKADCSHLNGGRIERAIVGLRIAQFGGSSSIDARAIAISDQYWTEADVPIKCTQIQIAGLSHRSVADTSAMKIVTETNRPTRLETNVARQFMAFV